MVRNIGFEPMIGESESHALPLGQFRIYWVIEYYEINLIFQEINIKKDKK